VTLRGILWGLFIGLLGQVAAPLAAHAQEARFSLEGTSLLDTRALHGFQDSVELGAPGRVLYGAGLEIGHWYGAFGVTWVSTSWGFNRGWNVERLRKNVVDAVPEPLTRATAHLFLFRLPAPRYRLEAGRFSLVVQGTLGLRTGSIRGADGLNAVPTELVLPLRASALFHWNLRWSMDVSAEWVHSLATGSPSVVIGLGLRRAFGASLPPG
jgi:hypothetical protein